MLVATNTDVPPHLWTTMMFSTANYSQKVYDFVEDQACRRLSKDASMTIKHKTTVLKKSSYAEYFYQ